MSGDSSSSSRGRSASDPTDEFAEILGPDVPGPGSAKKQHSKSVYGTITKRGKKMVAGASKAFNLNGRPKSPSAAKPKAKDDSTASPAKKSGSAPAPAPGGKTEEELREEEELQLALALSKSEAENKEKEKLRVTSSLLNRGGWGASNGVSAPPRSPSPPLASNEASELDKYLNRPYWEEQQKASQHQNIYASVGSKKLSVTKASALIGDDGPEEGGGNIRVASPPPVTNKTSEALQMSNENEVSEFVATFRAQLEIFVNRLKSNQSRGRPIANDTAVQSLFVNITAMHGQLLQHLQQQEARRVWYEQMQDKLSQTRDARAALEALREEHRERERKEREEQQRIRQIQMMQKLEVMRKKKQEYLEYQRQLAVHHMAQTERQLLQQPQQYYPAPLSGAMGPGIDLIPQGGQPPMAGGPGGYPPSSLPGYHDNGQQPPAYMHYGHQQQHMGGGQPPYTSMVTSPGQTPPQMVHGQMPNQMAPQHQQQQLGPVPQIQPQMGGPPGQQQGMPQMGGPGQMPPQMAPGQQPAISMGPGQVQGQQMGQVQSQQMGPGQLQTQPMGLGQLALPAPPQQQPPVPQPEETEAALISFD